MLSQLSSNWMWVVLRGVLAILFGLAALIVPGATFFVLVLWLGAYLFVDGIFSVIAAMQNRAGNERWWVLLLEGILGIVAGVITFVQPSITGVTLVILIGAWAVVTGVLEIVAAIRLRKEIKGELRLVLAGVLSVIAGILLFVFPETGTLVVVWITGVYALLFGILMLVLGLRLRGMKGQMGSGAAATA